MSIKKIQGDGKIKLIFENLIFRQLLAQACSSMYDLFSPDTKGLRELKICETKNCKIRVSEMDLEKCRNCGKIANEQIFIAFTYILMDFVLLWHKITYNRTYFQNA